MTSSPRLGYIIIYVQDVVSTVIFYQKAFGFTQRFLDEGKQYAEIETGQTILAFAQEEFIKNAHDFRLNRSQELPAGVEIAFVVDHVDSQHEQAIKAGAVEVASPVQKPWGQRVSYVRDPNGVLVEICDAAQELKE